MSNPSQPFTFRECGAVLRAAVERHDATELGDIARRLNVVYSQTTCLFTWATGLTLQSEVDVQSIARFADLLGKVAARFGTVQHHFEIGLATVIAESAARGSQPRSPSTVARHVARMRQIAAHDVTRFEDRLVNNVMVELTPDEIARVEGYHDAAALVLVERLGEVVGGRLILSHDRLSVSNRALDTRTAAEEALNSLARGRSFVVTRNPLTERLFLIAGAWE